MYVCKQLLPTWMRSKDKVLFCVFFTHTVLGKIKSKTQTHALFLKIAQKHYWNIYSNTIPLFSNNGFSKSVWLVWVSSNTESNASFKHLVIITHRENMQKRLQVSRFHTFRMDSFVTLRPFPMHPIINLICCSWKTFEASCRIAKVISLPASQTDVKHG